MAELETEAARALVLLDENALRRVVSEEVAHAVRPLVEGLQGLRHEPPDKSASENDGDKLMTPNEVAVYLSIDQRELRRLRKESGFPTPVRISERRLRWWQSELDEWLRCSR